MEKLLLLVLLAIASVTASANEQKANSDKNVICAAYSQAYVVLTQNKIKNIESSGGDSMRYKVLQSRAVGVLENNFGLMKKKIDSGKLSRESVDSALGVLVEKYSLELEPIADDLGALFKYQVEKEKKPGCK